MNRRQLIGTLGTAGAVALFTGTAAAASDEQEEHGKQFDACAKACADCQIECHSCGAHCGQLMVNGHKQHMETQKLCSDCGDVCAAAANIMARRGTLAWTICQACVEACEKCAQACEKHPDDKRMKACADECKKCAKACRDLLAYIGKKTSSPS